MEYKMVTIPFDLETAKKINIGERVGQIVTEKGRNRAEIVYEDNSSICPLLVVIHSISVSADWFSATGKAFSSENRLLLEVPEYTTFKDGDVLSNEEGNFIFILNANGKYLTSLYASLAAGTSLNISDDIAAHENHIECIPSLGQLNLMAHYMDELNKAFAYVSASPLSSTWYRSSTESSPSVAWYVDFSIGSAYYSDKYNSSRVRAVIDF